MRLFRARTDFRAVVDEVERGDGVEFVRVFAGQLFAVERPSRLPEPKIGMINEFYDEVVPKGPFGMSVEIDKYMQLKEIK